MDYGIALTIIASVAGVLLVAAIVLLVVAVQDSKQLRSEFN